MRHSKNGYKQYKNPSYLTLKEEHDYTYQELCEILKEEPKTGNSKPSQLERWSMFFDFVKISRSLFHVKKVRKDSIGEKYKRIIYKGINPTDKYYNAMNPQSSYAKIVGLGQSRMGELDTDFISQLHSTNKHFYNEDNSISIRMEDLITGYTWSIHSKYILAPKEKGNFEIECNFMCEEYSEIITKIINVIVE